MDDLCVFTYLTRHICIKLKKIDMIKKLNARPFLYVHFLAYDSGVLRSNFGVSRESPLHLLRG